jgi:hypothetical protein
VAPRRSVERKWVFSLAFRNLCQYSVDFTFSKTKNGVESGQTGSKLDQTTYHTCIVRRKAVCRDSEGEVANKLSRHKT